MGCQHSTLFYCQKALGILKIRLCCFLEDSCGTLLGIVVSILNHVTELKSLFAKNVL